MELKKKKKNTPKQKDDPSNRFTNIKDIRNKFLYTYDGYIFSYINIFNFNTSLFTDKEKQMITKDLSASISVYNKPFKFLAVSRAVDIIPLLNYYKDMLRETRNPIRRELIRREINTLTNFATLGEVTERLFYFVLFRKYEDEVEKEFTKDMNEFERSILKYGIKTKILEEKEIRQLANLFFFQ